MRQHQRSSLNTSTRSRPIFALALAATCLVGSARAEDWTGAYIGGFGDYEHAFRDTSVPSKYSVSATPERAGEGVGGLAGYNWQFGSYVLGVEGDLRWSEISPNMTYLAHVGTQAIHIHTDFDYLASLRGRLGYEFGRVLAYGTGGVAWMHGQSYLFMTDGAAPDWGAPIAVENASAWDWGWVAGGGLEYRVLPAVVLRAEYLHYQFESQLYDYSALGIPTTAAGRVDAVRAAVITRF